MVEKKLTQYHAKRDFSQTTEPKGKKIRHGNSFVIQKHNARHLHYDFRLEFNGVLKSWAVPKGVPRNYTDKHLAVETEDHPIEYGKFEGTIPEGQYGAGTVKIWDSGEYEQIDSEYHPRQTMNSAYKKGTLKFRLNGKKYKGCYALVRFKSEDSKKMWLIFRIKR